MTTNAPTPGTPGPLSSASALLSAPLDRLAENPALDGLVDKVSGIVAERLPQGVIRDILHGVPIGHPLHPSLAQAALGSLTSASLLTVVPGTERAGDVLTLAGIAAAVPTALAGWADWSQGQRTHQRLGLVHAGSNAAGLLLYAASLIGPARSRRRLRVLGALVVGVGGAMGGHLAYRFALGANHVEAVPHLIAEGWHPVGPLAGFADGEPRRAEVAGVPVVVVRRGAGADVLADQCSHLAGPLSGGSVVTERGAACIVCPWHGSIFRLADGAVVHGPATAPAPTLEARVVAGEVEVRLVGASG